MRRYEVTLTVDGVTRSYLSNPVMDFWLAWSTANQQVRKDLKRQGKDVGKTQYIKAL